MMKLTNISLMEEKTGRYLVENLSLTINDTTKLAIIGEEGNGKSSLLQVIRNKQELIPYLHVSGDVQSSYQTIGYLNQSLIEEQEDLTKSIYSSFSGFIFHMMGMFIFSMFFAFFGTIIIRRVILR